MVNTARRILEIAGVIFAVLVAGGCERASRRSVNLLGSTSIQPFAEILAEQYTKQNPGRFVEVQGGGSTAGLQAAADGLADIGMCSRSLTPTETEQFRAILIARDGLAIVVNPQNNVRSLSLEALRAVFAGNITNWRSIGGTDNPIRPITREEGSGTRESFVRLVMHHELITRRAITQESNGAVRELVKGDPAAIGYMSLGLVDLELRALTVGKAHPTVESVLAGSYELVRPLLFVTRGQISPAVQSFLDFVLSPDGQRLLEKEGLVRVR